MAEANLPHAKEAIQDYWTQLLRQNCKGTTLGSGLVT